LVDSRKREKFFDVARVANRDVIVDPVRAVDDDVVDVIIGVGDMLVYGVSDRLKLLGLDTDKSFFYWGWFLPLEFLISGSECCSSTCLVKLNENNYKRHLNVKHTLKNRPANK
jgi:hypothetical protein